MRTLGYSLGERDSKDKKSGSIIPPRSIIRLTYRSQNKGGGKIIEITLTYYPHYRDVRCLAGGLPPPSNCLETLDKMPRTDYIQNFVHDHPSPYHMDPRDVLIPEMIIDGKYSDNVQRPQQLIRNHPAQHNCMAVIDSTADGPFVATYQLIWRAAVAIDAMCVRRGLVGWAPCKSVGT